MYSAAASSQSIPGKTLSMHGLYPATVTPFAADGSIDMAGLRRHLQAVYSAEGVTGVVVNSGIGELLQLQLSEMAATIELATQIRAPGQLVISGIEGHNPERLIEAGLVAKRAGADALLVLPAFDRRAYRRLNGHVPSVLALFERLGREIDLPMVIFQYPNSSGSAYSIEALEAIADLPHVVAVKTATEGHFDSYVEMWDRLSDKIAVLVGVDSPPLIDMLRHGAHGALIGISAIATAEWGRLMALVSQGKQDDADRLYAEVCLPLMQAVFQNQKPASLMNEAAATKEALFQMGEIPSARARFPAVHPTEDEKQVIAQALRGAGLVKA